MQVTSGKYELPVSIADSSLKLARSSKHKFYSGVHYIRVDIKEE